jgi:dTDP-4-amino-4,6-dideoxygalactose transaminase
MFGSDHAPPIATREYDRAMSLPIWAGMTGDDVVGIVEALASILDGCRLD